MSVQDRQQDAPSKSPGRSRAAPKPPAWHRISAESGFLRSELFNRGTIEETQKFLEAVLAAAIRHKLPHVLICVRNSVPIFTVERYGFSRYLDLAFKSKYRIALVGDALELRIAHQYVATMARLRGVNLRAFPEEASAIAWLTAGEPPQPLSRT
ncbi:MAG TPA: STAS/SEC14 domain-containing protein [Burkholderiales bacterium]|nr:STAS/SEC14 domain-containing protein [Burkholderiales bacterium]